MLSTLLNSIQTTLAGSKGFVVTSLLPVVLFFLGSAWMYSRLPGHSAVALTKLISESPGVAGILLALVLLTIALAFSSLNTVLREVLEGKLLSLIPPLERKIMAGQMRKLDAAQKKFSQCQRDYWEFRRAKWIDQLRTERQKPNTAAGAAKAAPPADPDQALTQQIAGIEAKISNYELVPFLDLKAAYNGLLSQLQLYNPPNPDHWLSQLHVRFYRSIPLVEQRLEKARIDAYWKMNEYADIPEATRLGNIGATMRSYAQSRYEISLDVFWPRIQRVIQEDQGMFSTVQDAKIQLDLFVSCTWLAGFFAAVWIPWLGVRGTDWPTFLVAWLVAPVCTWGSYRLACVSYQSFSQVVRAAIDLLRFKLLEELHMPLPFGIDEEKDTWKRLADWIGYDSLDGGFLYRNK
jgi:hypothetical protein